ncbi:LacI family DNA-binding transcriptional regulator [Actinopolymorpha alba]|uniref:LacI family DNA-binding transcriptional regulator n=1 Tax=Actinopolymorpha alba TaxID=533267 RepID=UPI000377058C|nr:LacI family DNA-binding transcriptional regulator [Actinopolymorpha alba]
MALRAGVSIGTASGVFRSNSSVSDKARAAVLAAASEIGYHPRRRVTRTLPNGVTAIGLLARAQHYVGPSNPFYGPVLYGAQVATGELGLSLVLETLRDDVEAGELPLSVERRQVQGLLVVGTVSDDYLHALLKSRVPCVLVDHQPDTSPIDSVCADDHRGGYLATKHLIQLGHRTPPPAMISGPPWSTSVSSRLAGYRRALVEEGLSIDPAYIREGHFTADSGRQEMAALLDLPVPPTAIFCCNDNLALGVIDLLRERGVVVPDECSVVGYDDIAMAAHSVPQLTTIAVDKELLGMQAVWNLIQRIGSPRLGIRETRIGVELVERHSASLKRIPA